MSLKKQADNLNVSLGSIIQLILEVPAYFHTSSITQVKFCYKTLTENLGKAE